jgi:hypothetical protein
MTTRLLEAVAANELAIAELTFITIPGSIIVSAASATIAQRRSGFRRDVFFMSTS